MRLLLDTHVLLWALIEPKRLSPEFRILLENPDHEVLFSTASIWRMSIKAALGRADFQVAPATMCLNSYHDAERPHVCGVT